MTQLLRWNPRERKSHGQNTSSSSIEAIWLVRGPSAYWALVLESVPGGGRDTRKSPARVVVIIANAQSHTHTHTHQDRGVSKGEHNGAKVLGENARSNV